MHFLDRDAAILFRLFTGLLSKAKPDWQDRNDLKTLLNSLITRPQEHHGLVLDFLKSNWQKMDTL